MDWLDLPEVQVTLRVFSNTTVQKHQFFRAQLSSQSNSLQKINSEHINIFSCKYYISGNISLQ